MIIKHRINTTKELNAVPTHYGVEIDLRLYQGELVLAHDPFIEGERFEDWLESYRHNTLILNVKEDGLEGCIIEKLLNYKNVDYFFLDQPFPTLRKSSIAGHPVAVRLSEYELPINILDLEVKWVWLDSFMGNWDYLGNYKEWLSKADLSLCLVSPELQGRTNPREIELITEKLDKLNLRLAAVCTKYPEKWESLLL